jgi:hypothetical protein
MFFDEEFLTVSSNMGLYAGTNKTNNFRVKLARPLQFKGKYKVALYSISYPNSYRKFTENQHSHIDIFWNRQSGIRHTNVRMAIARGNFYTNEELITYLNKEITDSLKIFKETIDKSITHHQQHARAARAVVVTATGGIPLTKDQLIENLQKRIEELENGAEIHQTWKEGVVKELAVKEQHMKEMEVNLAQAEGDLNFWKFNWNLAQTDITKEQAEITRLKKEKDELVKKSAGASDAEKTKLNADIATLEGKVKKANDDLQAAIKKEQEASAKAAVFESQLKEEQRKKAMLEIEKTNMKKDLDDKTAEKAKTDAIVRELRADIARLKKAPVKPPASPAKPAEPAKPKPGDIPHFDIGRDEVHIPEEIKNKPHHFADEESFHDHHEFKREAPHPNMLNIPAPTEIKWPINENLKLYLRRPYTTKNGLQMPFYFYKPNPEQLIPVHEDLEKANIKFSISDRVSVEFDPLIIDHIVLSKDMSYITGFSANPTQEIHNRSTGVAMPDLHAGIHGFCVYETNGLVANTIFNDRLMPLLQYVTIGGEPGKPHEIVYSAKRYVPVATHYIEDLHFKVSTIFNEPMPFDWGVMVLTLSLTPAVD